MKSHLPLILLAAIGFSPVAVAQCDGCDLEVATYPDGFFLGAQPIAGVAISWTPDPTSHSGTCNGEQAPCTSTPCKLGTGTLRVTVHAGTADVYNPGKAGQDNDHKAHLTAGNWADFKVGKRPPINLECQTYQFTELLDIVTAAGAANEEAWKVSAHCTTCDV